MTGAAAEEAPIIVSEGGPPKIRVEKYPQMVEVGLALEQHRDGAPITARCRRCGEVLAVEIVATTSVTTVRCRAGCTWMRLKGGGSQ